MNIFLVAGSLISIFYVSVALALEPSEEDQDLATLGARVYETSDDFDRSELLLKYRRHRREFFWPYQESSYDGLDFGLDIVASQGSAAKADYDTNMVQGIIGKPFGSSGYAEGRLGRHELDRGQGAGSKRIWPWSFWTSLPIGGKADMQLSGARDFVYQEGVQPAGVTQALVRKNAKLALAWRPHERLRLNGEGQYGSWSDDNTSRQFDGAVLYGISPSWPWIWVGAAFEYINYDNVVDDYWSPELFTSYGLQIDSSFPVAASLEASASMNVERIKEKGSDAGVGYYINVGFDWTLTKSTHLLANYERTSSIQKTSHWHDNMAIVRISGSLF